MRCVSRRKSGLIPTHNRPSVCFADASADKMGFSSRRRQRNLIISRKYELVPMSFDSIERNRKKKLCVLELHHYGVYSETRTFFLFKLSNVLISMLIKQHFPPVFSDICTIRAHEKTKWCVVLFLAGRCWVRSGYEGLRRYFTTFLQS